MKKTFLCLLFSFALLLTGCFSSTAEESLKADDYFTSRDLSGQWDEKEAENISLEGSLTIEKAGVYVLSGEMEGTVTVNAGDQDKVQLVLSGVSISSSASAAILVENADKVFITLAEGTENELTCTGFDASSDVDGAVFSRDDIVFNGTGRLTIVSQGHGIVGKDDVKFAGGEYSVTAQGRGIDANDSVRIAGGSFTIVSEKDCIRAKNEEDADKGYVVIFGGSFSLTAGGGAVNGETHTDSMFFGRGQRYASTAAAAQDSTESKKGVKANNWVAILDGEFILDTADDALHTDGDLTVSGGNFTISTGDDGMHANNALTISGGEIRILSSYEGLEASSVTIQGGQITLTASDDGINAAGGNDGSGWGFNDMFSSDGSSILISGGTLYIDAEGDGIDSNGNLTVTGGTIIVSGPTNSGNGALDYNGTASISGGTFIAAGAMGMAETFGAASTQPSALVSISGQGGSEITVKDENGAVILSGTVGKSFQSVVVSCPEMQVGKTYTVAAGGASATLTLSSVSGGGNGGMGGFGGGRNGGQGGWQNQPQQGAPAQGMPQGGPQGGFGGGRGR